MRVRVVNSHPASAPQRWLAGWLFATRFSGKNRLSHFARSRILILLTPQQKSLAVSAIVLMYGMLLYQNYFTISAVPPFDIVAHGVLPYAPRLARRPFGFGSFA